MKSPLTGKEMKLIKERRQMEFRKESFEIIFHYFECDKSGEQFTTSALDIVNINQVYNKYRDKYNIPFPDEIFRIRNKYGLSSSKFSLLLGFGVNSYRQYEAGEMPSISNARLIQMVNDAEKFLDILELSNVFDEKSKTKLKQKAYSLIEEQHNNFAETNLTNYLLGNHLADIYSGYRNPSFEKFTEMIVFFSHKLKPYKTKLNKLLFYADFLMFKESCFSISGMRYKAINMGPVPNNFQSIFEYLENNNIIEIHYTSFPQGYSGEQFNPKKGRTFNENLFSDEEKTILEKIATAFKSTSTNDIVEISHLEEAWRKNKNEKNIISYEYAFELTQV